MQYRSPIHEWIAHSVDDELTEAGFVVSDDIRLAAVEKLESSDYLWEDYLWPVVTEVTDSIRARFCLD